jgi:dihydrofolate reductase
VIGREGKLPWDLPDDRIYFRKVTLGKVMILGRKTYEAIGRLLPDRIHIILTTDRSYSVPGALIAHSKQEALKLAVQEANTIHEDEIIIAGGGKVYEEFLPETDRLHLTYVDAELEGDARFPKVDLSKWHEVSRTHHPVDHQHAYAFDTVVYERT